MRQCDESCMQTIMRMKNENQNENEKIKNENDFVKDFELSIKLIVQQALQTAILCRMLVAIAAIGDCNKESKRVSRCNDSTLRAVPG